MNKINLEAPTGFPPKVWTKAEELALQNACELIAIREQLAAKDAEIAELVAQRDKARYNAEAADDFRGAYLRERNEALEQLTEARECVRRLCGAIRSATIMHGMDASNRDELLSALAATPEHLRNA